MVDFDPKWLSVFVTDRQARSSRVNFSILDFE